MSVSLAGRHRRKSAFAARRHRGALCAGWLAVAGCLALGAGCGGDDDAGEASLPVASVRAAIDALAPAANLGHRGTGMTRPGHPYPENSLSSIEAAIADGSDGVEVDVELTADGRLIVMHDDRLDRTTDCEGCVSDWQFADVRDCRLLDGAGLPTDEVPPTLDEVFAVLPPDALVNVELKAFGNACVRQGTGPADLARAGADEVRALGVERRTLFSSFSRDVLVVMDEEHADLYAALLFSIPMREHVEWAIERGLAAIHPLFAIPAADVDLALEAGLQVNVWTVNDAARMQAMIDLGATAIITDVPELLEQVLAGVD